MSSSPTYEPYMSDLYSLSQLGQEFTTFEGFYQDWKLKMQFGSQIKWNVIGGSNFWPDHAANYETTWTNQIILGRNDHAFQISKLAVHAQDSTFNIKCLVPEDKSQSQRSLVTLK